jgi:2-polyprenyl-6-methoxyphenol hydroxylase-like FAD-dependent oxidoreductase
MSIHPLTRTHSHLSPLIVALVPASRSGQVCHRESVSTDAVIVGAGIAGLTAAIALDRAGLQVQVVERAIALTQAGTALSLWPNALAALEHIRLRDAVTGIGMAEPAGVVKDSSGKVLMTIDQKRLSEDLGSQTLIVRRSDLQHLLLDRASHLRVRLNTRATRIGLEDNSALVSLVGGEPLRASVVLACDGIRSIARPLFDNPPLTYRGRTSWRAVLDDAAHLSAAATLTVGGGNQFIAGPLRDGAVYWAADVGLPEGANVAMADRKGFLLNTFATWHDPIPELIERTDNDQLVIADFYDSVPKRLVSGRVALLGDAGHPMTPDLGQGACQGIEDAVVMAACLKLVDGPAEALSKYESLRLRRVQRVVRSSRRLGRLATSRSAVVVSARNFVARTMPSSANARITAGVAGEAAFTRTLPLL